LGAITLAASSTADFIDAIASLVGALAWPVTILVVVVVFRDRVRAILEELRKRAKSDDVTVKVGPFVFSALAKSATQMGAATARRAAAEAKGDDEVSEAVAATASAMASFASHTDAWSTTSPRILWVDDTPQNNIYERRAFEALGIDVLICTSTEQALNLVETQTFDVIISNMGRPSDNQAGYTLLDKLRPGNTTPFVVYSSSNRPEHKEKARRHGAVGATNNPTELLALVQKALTATPGGTG
jgi:CheY-like chemotaxis protein